MRELPKIDPHHHLWDLKAVYYPWLSDKVEPKMWGDYASIRRDFLADEYIRLARAENVVKSVHVQANAADGLAETRWCQQVADRHGFPHGIVAHVNLEAADVERLLDQHMEAKNFRGVRQILGHTQDPHRKGPSAHDLMRDDAWKRGLKALGRRGGSFDFQIFPAQMADAARTAGENPDMRFVVCHTGMPFDGSPEGRELWRSGMRALSQRPNVCAKLSGPHMFLREWTVESYRPLFEETVELFGPARCMIASNVPPDAAVIGFDEIYRRFYKLAAPYSETEQRAMFHDTAAGFYRL
jgi:predicted TIM-barrel fold metal-dependent hydrolase